MSSNTVILQLICPDRPGLVSQISAWIANHNGNILHADHHTDKREALFLSRIEWDLKDFDLSRELIRKECEDLANRLQGEFQVKFSDEIPNVAILVSKQEHCLLDILWRVRSRELKMNVPLVISNHKSLESICKEFSISFKYIPMTNDIKYNSESEILDLLNDYNIQLVVLAKYMQILSPEFLQRFPNIINIHHSFLPAFKGANPYHQAWKRGVKLIGATAHYVTEDLDAGPIIDQTIAHVTHRDEVEDLVRKGRDMERIALARALRLHLHHQVMIYHGRTAIFA